MSKSPQKPIRTKNLVLNINLEVTSTPRLRKESSCYEDKKLKIGIHKLILTFPGRLSA